MLATQDDIESILYAKHLCTFIYFRKLTNTYRRVLIRLSLYNKFMSIFRKLPSKWLDFQTFAVPATQNYFTSQNYRWRYARVYVTKPNYIRINFKRVVNVPNFHFIAIDLYCVWGRSNRNSTTIITTAQPPPPLTTAHTHTRSYRHIFLLATRFLCIIFMMCTFLHCCI